MMNSLSTLNERDDLFTFETPRDCFLLKCFDSVTLRDGYIRRVTQNVEGNIVSNYNRARLSCLHPPTRAQSRDRGCDPAAKYEP